MSSVVSATCLRPGTLSLVLLLLACVTAAPATACSLWGFGQLLCHSSSAKSCPAGQAFTGRQGKENGLVDELGNMHTYMREQLGPQV